MKSGKTKREQGLLMQEKAEECFLDDNYCSPASATPNQPSLNSEWWKAGKAGLQLTILVHFSCSFRQCALGNIVQKYCAKVCKKCPGSVIVAAKDIVAINSGRFLREKRFSLTCWHEWYIYTLGGTNIDAYRREHVILRGATIISCVGWPSMVIVMYGRTDRGMVINGQVFGNKVTSVANVLAVGGDPFASSKSSMVEENELMEIWGTNPFSCIDYLFLGHSYRCPPKNGRGPWNVRETFGILDLWLST